MSSEAMPDEASGELAKNITDGAFLAPLWHAIQLSHLATVDLDQASRDIGFPLPDLHLIGTLYAARGEPVRPTDLAAKLHVTTAALTNRTARLVDAGLVRREISDRDSRTYRISLTAEGVKAARAAIAQMAKASRFLSAFDILAPSDRERLELIVGTLHNRMKRSVYEVAPKLTATVTAGDRAAHVSASLFWLSDEAWAAVDRLMPKNVSGPRRADDRRVISGILHVLKSGCRWAECPTEYGPATVVYNRYYRWSRRAFWARMLEALSDHGINIPEDPANIA